MMHPAHLFLPALAALSLAGCQSVRDTLDIGEAKNPNPGPCPNAYSLFDASRLVEIKGAENIANVGFTGEINGVHSFCRYYADRPITANLEIDFGFGRGPAASGDERIYNYFVAVTRKDTAVINKKTFPIKVDFKGRDRVYVTEKIDKIVIPRASETTSGTNFEIIVGFELSQDQLKYNRQGKRFREDSGQALTQ